VKRALADEPIAIYGDGFQVRDVFYVADAVAAYIAAWRRIDRVKGRAFNLGGGPDNAVSLLQLIAYLEQVLERSVALRFFDWRAGDQRYYVSDIRAARVELGLARPTSWREGVAELCRWLQGEAAPPRRGRVARRAPEPLEARL
jgi:CDP-paratose 2-epimerase